MVLRQETRKSSFFSRKLILGEIHKITLFSNIYFLGSNVLFICLCSFACEVVDFKFVRIKKFRDISNNLVCNIFYTWNQDMNIIQFILCYDFILETVHDEAVPHQMGHVSGSNC